MEAMTAILGRRSIRKYTRQELADEVVRYLLEAAMAAPSAGNQQPWHFVVVDDRAALNAITEYHEYSSMLREAPLAIVVCGDGGLERHEGFWVQDCSAATQNLLLAAHAQGLGGVWLGVYPGQRCVEKTQELFGLPAEVIPLAIVALGYPAEHKPPADRFDASRVHRNKW